MKKISLLSFVALIAITSPCTLGAQTNPAAVNLPFSLTSQAIAILPSGVAVHRFSSIQTARTTAQATSDLTNQGATPSSNTGGWYHLNTDGIGLLASTTNPAGAIVVAVNTTGLTNIQVSWLCKTIFNQSARDNSVALQYRVGTTGNFTDVGTSSTYSSAGQANGATSSTFTETLPPAANNKPVVQLRWIYWESAGTSGSRDKIAVDDIAVSGASNCNAPALIAASGITASDATLTWTSVAGVPSYQYALTTSPVPPASGTLTTDTFFNVSGLTASTIYYAYARSVCNDSTFSEWALQSFTTTPAVQTGDSTFVVMTYNLLNYPGSTGSVRNPAFRTIISDANPDILVVQELGTDGFNTFRDSVMQNVDTGYAGGAFIDGPDSDNGIYFRRSRFQFISNTPVHTALRDISEFRVRHIASGDTLILYSAHLKASNATADEALRADEIDSLRKRTNSFSAGQYFLVCGDFNIYKSGEAAYQKLIAAGSNTNGKFNDVLNLPGTWNNSSYAIHHTQSPRLTAFGGGATGGLDDRFDMLLFSNAILQAGGFDTVGNSYKAYGNDGQHYNQALNTPPYAMYPSLVASALHDASDHLPVLVRLKHTPMSLRSSVAITAASSADMITVFPNPAHDILYLRANLMKSSTAHLMLYDINGRQLKEVLISGEPSIAAVDLSGLETGLYYLRCMETGVVYKVMHY